MDEDRHARRLSDSEDQISKLPDELLHDILVRLNSARAAARTSVLSRRWRHVWAHLPELSFDASSERAPPSPPSSILGSIDAALSANSEPGLQRLSIALYTDGFRRYVPPGGVAWWLRFASQRVVGELHLGLGSPLLWVGKEAQLELPACGRAKTIALTLHGAWRLRLPPASVFTSLTGLSIHGARVGGDELTALVCTQCPRLTNLRLYLIELADTFVVSIHSDTLLSLCFFAGNTRRLDVVTPRLEEVSLYPGINEARICAAKLQELAWHGGGFHAGRYLLQNVSRCIRSLKIGGIRSTLGLGSLLRRFDQVGKLNLEISIPQGIEWYGSFLNETSQLRKCKELRISVEWDDHVAVTPAVLHLLRSCNNTRKVSVKLFGSSDFFQRHSCQLPSCLCRLEPTYKISLNLLEELEITSYAGPHHVLQLAEQLCRCNNAPVLRKIIMDHRANYPPPPTKEACEKIRNMCQPNVEVKFYEFSKRVWVENI